MCRKKCGVSVDLAHVSTKWRSTNQSGILAERSFALRFFLCSVRDWHDADSCTYIWDNVRFHSQALVVVCASKLKVDSLLFGSIRCRVSLPSEVPSFAECVLRMLQYMAGCYRCQLVTECIWGPLVLLCCMKHSQQTFKGQHFRIHVACHWVLLFQPELDFLSNRLLLFPWSIQCEFVHSRYRVRYSLCHPAFLIWRRIKLQPFEVLKGSHTLKCGNNWALLTLFRMNSLRRTSGCVYVCVCVCVGGSVGVCLYWCHLVPGHFAELSLSDLVLLGSHRHLQSNHT